MNDKIIIKFYFSLLCRWANLITTLVEFLMRLSVVAEQLYQIEDSLEAAQEDVSHSLQGQGSFTVAEQGVA